MKITSKEAPFPKQEHQRILDEASKMGYKFLACPPMGDNNVLANYKFFKDKQSAEKYADSVPKTWLAGTVEKAYGKSLSDEREEGDVNYRFNIVEIESDDASRILSNYITHISAHLRELSISRLRISENGDLVADQSVK